MSTPRRLSVGLFAEGSSDYEFFRPLLRRLLEDVCSQGEPVVIGDAVALRGTGGRREDKIDDAVSRAREAIDLVVIHADGGGQPDRIREQQVDPGRRRSEALGIPAVGMVPIREMEAWALCDGDAIRRTWGTRLDDGALGIPANAVDVERITDPKATLKALHATVVRARGRTAVTTHLPRLAEELSFVRLRRVPAFAAFEADCRAALRGLGYI